MFGFAVEVGPDFNVLNKNRDAVSVSGGCILRSHRYYILEKNRRAHKVSHCHLSALENLDERQIKGNIPLVCRSGDGREKNKKKTTTGIQLFI